MPRYTIELARTRNDNTATPVRSEPYFGAPLARGLFVGFRKISPATPTSPAGGTWIARQRRGKRQLYKAIGPLGKTLDYAQACEAARLWAKELDANNGPTPVVTLPQLCTAYVADRRREKGDANADEYAARFANHVLNHAIAAIPLATLAQEDIKAWRATLPGANATRDHMLDKLKAALNFGVAQRIIAADRAIEWKSVKNLGAHGARDLYLDATQRAALVAAAPTEAQPFLRALCLLPTRPGPMAKSTVGDLRLRHAGHEHLHIGLGKDKVKTLKRNIPLAAATLAHFKAAARDKLPAAPLFTDATGAAWKRETWAAAVRQARTVAGLPDKTCAYTLRHSVITDMIVGGMDVLTVARIAGTSMRQIEKHYGHLLQGLARQQMAALAL